MMNIREHFTRLLSDPHARASTTARAIIGQLRGALNDAAEHEMTIKTALARYGNLGDGPDDRGNCFAYDAEHPWYDYGYRCKTCRCRLTEND